jgi:hypothetical protein
MKSDSLSAIEIRRDYLQHYSIKYFEKQKKTLPNMVVLLKPLFAAFRRSLK